MGSSHMRYAALCFLAIFAQPVCTQVSDLNSVNFKIERSPLSERLTQQTVRQSFQDHAGIMWFLTQEGLHRFDGYNVLRYTANNDVPGSITHNNVRHILEDHLGDIWIATVGGGIVRYNKADRTFKQIGADRLGNNLLSNNVTSLFADDSGFIWIGYLEGKISYFDPIKQKLIHATAFNESQKDIGAINDFAQHHHRSIWVATTRAGLLNYDHELDAVTQHSSEYSEESPTNTEHITALIADKVEGKLWIGSRANGLYSYSWRKNTSDYFSKDQIKDDSVNHLYLDASNGLWVSTERGLLARNIHDGFSLFDKNTSHLTDDLVFSMYQDRQGSYWIGTYYGLFAGHESVFELYDSKSGLQSETITSFAESSSGDIWIGTYSGIFKYPPRRSEVSLRQFELLDGTEGAKVMSVSTFGNHLWVGYRNQGLERINLEDNSSISYDPEKPGSNEITSLRAVSDDTAIVTTNGGGAFRISFLIGEEEPRLEWFADEGHFYSSQALDDGEFLLTSTEGVLKIGTNQSSSIAQSNHILDALQTSDKKLWLGTQYAGLLFVEPNEKQWSNDADIARTQISESNTIYAIQQSPDNLWLSSANGLIALRKDLTSYRPYFSSDGLQDNEFNFGASFKDNKGRLYFGGNRGFNRFDPEKIVDDLDPPKLLMTDIHVAGEPLLADTAYEIPELIELKWQDYYVDFFFSVVDYSDPSRNQYKYRLKNFDQDWIDIGNRHSVSFTSLPSGNYTLQIMGANPNRVWSERPMEIGLYVHPPPWYSWWAFTGYSFVVLSFAAMARRNYDSNNQREQAEEYADQMYVTADKAMNAMQEQLMNEAFMQRNLSNYYTGALQIISDLLEQQAIDIRDEILIEQFANNQERFQVLFFLERQMIMLGAGLYTDFRVIAEHVLTSKIKKHQLKGSELALINICTERKIPSSVAAPLAIIANELIDNAFAYAFEEFTGIQFIKVSLEEREDLNGWTLEVIDNGCGVPDSVDPANPTTLGFSLIQKCANQLGASLELRRSGGSHFLLQLPRIPLDVYDGS